MINVFAVFWKTAANTAKSGFCKGQNEGFAQFCTGTVIVTFLKFGHDKRFCCFYWKTAANTAK